MPLRLLILDCDGVLIRSEAANLAYYNHLFAAFDLPEVGADDRERLRLLHTLSTPQVVHTFFPAALQAEAHRYAASVDYGRFTSLLDAEPGWGDVLPRLRRRFAVSVATNRGQSAKHVLAAVGLLDHLDLVVTTQDVERPKPHPDLLWKVLDHFGVAAGDAAYVGDSGLDRQAALAACVPFLGFRDGSASAAQTPAEVEAWLEQVAPQACSDSMAPAVSLNRDEKWRPG